MGTLPFRLLAASYGAEIVYTEEIVDLKLVPQLPCPRPDRVNDRGGDWSYENISWKNVFLTSIYITSIHFSCADP